MRQALKNLFLSDEWWTPWLILAALAILFPACYVVAQLIVYGTVRW